MSSTGAGDRYHHFLPQMYLRRWTDSRRPPPFTPFLWIYSRGSATATRRAPKTFARKRGFYRVRNEFLHSDDPEAVERGLSTIESNAAVAFREIERDGIVTDERTRASLAEFVGSLELRTEKADEALARRLKEMASRPAERLLEMGGGEDAVRARLIAAGCPPGDAALEGLREMSARAARAVSESRDTRIRQLVTTGTSIAGLLIQMNWCVATAPLASSLVTSDAPVLIPETGPPKKWWAPRGVGFAQEGAEIMLPLDPRRLLIATHKPAPPAKELTRDEVDLVNSWTIANAFRYVICHRSRPQIARAVDAQVPIFTDDISH